MEALEAIYKRYSCRDYLEKEVGQEEIEKILKAALAAPTACNTRNWSFLVVKDKATLDQMADGNGRAAEPLRKCAFAILIVSDMDLTFSRAPDYWIIDGAIAGENMCIAATALGIGSVWLGTYPQKEKCLAQQKLFHLSDNLVPHSIIAFGYPKDPEAFEKDNKGIANSDDKIHYERW